MFRFDPLHRGCTTARSVFAINAACLLIPHAVLLAFHQYKDGHKNHRHLIGGRGEMGEMVSID